ncbi:MAG: glycoside-pentoside-hexuronide (GPH):cation symporter [Eubacteriales bacterium]|nr:glycoside-pentoside-hexuronide (GPH):cation symporter [Eubacteriales bacterium]
MTTSTQIPGRSVLKTSLIEKIAYGMGDVACNVVFAITSSLLVYFYTNVVGVSAALVGTILLVSRLFDGISDLAMAQIMDKVNSKHGKYRCWVLWMAIPYGLSAVLLVCVPSHATQFIQAIYIFITYNLCTTVCYTALNLPYSSLAPTMTNDDNDLAKLNLFRMSMSPIGNLIITALTLPFINRLGGDRKAWVIVTVIYAVIAFGMLMWTFFGTKERFRPAAAKEAEGLPLATRLGAAFRNKYFVMLTLTMIAVSLYQNVNGTCTTYYAQYVLGNVEVMGVLQTAEKIPWIIGVIILAPFIRKFGKRNLVLFGAILNVVAMCAVQFAPTSYPVLIVSAVLRGFGEAPFYGCIFTMIADAIEFGHWKTGIRVHALLFSAFTVGQKLGGGIAAWAIGQLMTISGFTGLEVEIPSAVSMVQNLYIWGSVVAWGAVAVIMLFYHLDQQYDGIVADLAKREQV